MNHDQIPKKIVNYKDVMNIFLAMSKIEINSAIEQDHFLNQLIEQIVDANTSIDYTKLSKQQAYLIVRASMFYLNHMLNNLPVRPEGGFISYLFNQNTKGKYYNAICKLYNQIAQSEYYQNAMDINSLIVEASESKILDLSYLSIRNEDINKFAILNHLKHLRIVELIIDNKTLRQHFKEGNFTCFQQLLNQIAQLKELESLKLSGFDLHETRDNSNIIEKLKDNLLKLNQLITLDLSDNQLTDSSLQILFDINYEGSIFSGKTNFTNLRYLNLSYNLIRFASYHEDEPANEPHKTFLDTLYNRGIQLDLTCNHIHFFKEEQHIHILSPIFQQYKNVYYNRDIKVNSLINPDYFIDLNHCVVTVANTVKHEHAQLFANFLDDYSQHCVMKYHLVQNTNTNKQYDTTIKVHELPALDNFIYNRSNNYTYGKFYICNKLIFNLMEDAIIKDAIEGIPQNLCRLHFSYSKNSINCAGYCHKITYEFFDTNLKPSLVAVPRFDLTNRLPAQWSTLCFSMLKNIIAWNDLYQNDNAIQQRLKLSG